MFQLGGGGENGSSGDALNGDCIRPSPQPATVSPPSASSIGHSQVRVWEIAIGGQSGGKFANHALGCERTGSDNACARVASNYSFAKLMEIAESVPTGRVRATSDKILNFYNFTRAL